MHNYCGRKNPPHQLPNILTSIPIEDDAMYNLKYTMKLLALSKSSKIQIISH